MADYIDPVTASPEQYRLLMENEHVRVLEMSLPAGVRDEQHSHLPETVYFVQGSTVRVQMPNGEHVELEFADGDVMWHEPWTHQVENIGDRDLRAVIVESKGA